MHDFDEPDDQGERLFLTWIHGAAIGFSLLIIFVLIGVYKGALAGDPEYEALALWLLTIKVVFFGPFVFGFMYRIAYPKIDQWIDR